MPSRQRLVLRELHTFLKLTKMPNTLKRVNVVQAYVNLSVLAIHAASNFISKIHTISLLNAMNACDGNCRRYK